MKNVKENKRRWKQLVAIFIVAVMLFTTPHIVGFASMGKEEATTAAADGNPVPLSRIHPAAYAYIY